MSAKEMVETQIIPRGVRDEKVLRAASVVRRDKFVPDNLRMFAYSDCPLPLSDGQTISQPYMVAAMTELLQLDRQAVVLEIGTGSGYQTAILAEIAALVFTVEIIESLAQSARRLLTELGYANIHYKTGDGYFGWEEHGPYDAIIVTAAPEKAPLHLIDQLKPEGRMVIPIGPLDGSQTLYLIRKDRNGELERTAAMEVRFVPLTGAH